MRISVFFVVLIVFLGGRSLPAQQQGSPSTQQPPGKVIQLKELKIDVRQELPTVQILDRRIEGEFEQVKVAKDFQAELIGQTEKILFNPITSGRVQPIENPARLLAKKRF